MFTQPNYLYNQYGYQGYSPIKNNFPLNRVVPTPIYMNSLQTKHNSIGNVSNFPKIIETPIKNKIQQSNISLKTSSNSDQNEIQKSKQNKQNICNACSKNFKDNQQKLHINHQNKINPTQGLTNFATPSFTSLNSSKISISKKGYKQFNPLQLYEEKIKQMQAKTEEEKEMKNQKSHNKQPFNTPKKVNSSNIMESPIKTIKKQIPQTQHITPPKTSQIFKPHNLGIQSYSEKQKQKYQDQFSIYQLLNQQSFEVQQKTKSNKVSIKAVKNNNKNTNSSKQDNKQINKNTHPFKSYQSPIKPQFESMSFQSTSLRYLI